MRVLVAVLGVLTIPTFSDAQSIQTQNVHATETFAEPFSSLGNLRALSGGDLLVTDRIEKAVYKINFGNGSYEMIGFNGGGPQEYDMPTAVFPAGARTSAIIDLGNTRVAIIDDEGRISATYPMVSESGFKMPTGGDEQGNLYYQNQGVSFRMGPRANEKPAPTEAFLTRWNPANGEEETVATIAIPSRPRGTGSLRFNGGQISGMPAPRPLRPLDAFAVGRDGRVGIARHDPYHVEWLNPDGSTTIGDNIQYTSTPFRRSDQEGWIEAQSSGSGGGSGGSTIVSFITTSSGAGGGGGTHTFSMPVPDIDEVDFPDVFPPFTRRAVSISHEGDMWVQRVESYDVEGTLFDVFDSSGQLVRRVRIPEGRTILGFGPHSLYAYTMDEDDLQWLERYEI